MEQYSCRDGFSGRRWDADSSWKNNGWGENHDNHDSCGSWSKKADNSESPEISKWSNHVECSKDTGRNSQERFKDRWSKPQDHARWSSTEPTIVPISHSYTLSDKKAEISMKSDMVSSRDLNSRTCRVAQDQNGTVERWSSYERVVVHERAQWRSNSKQDGFDIVPNRIDINVYDQPYVCEKSWGSDRVQKSNFFVPRTSFLKSNRRTWAWGKKGWCNKIDTHEDYWVHRDECTSDWSDWNGLAKHGYSARTWSIDANHIPPKLDKKSSQMKLANSILKSNLLPSTNRSGTHRPKISTERALPLDRWDAFSQDYIPISNHGAFDEDFLQMQVPSVIPQPPISSPDKCFGPVSELTCSTDVGREWTITSEASL